MILKIQTALLLLLIGCCSVSAQTGLGTSKAPAHVRTTADFRELLLASEWMWVNVRANVPERACVFAKDGTFRHPNFVAKYEIKDIRTVELTKKGGRAILNFDPTYTTFDAIDFDQKRITGHRK